MNIGASLLYRQAMQVEASIDFIASLPKLLVHPVLNPRALEGQHVPGIKRLNALVNQCIPGARGLPDRGQPPGGRVTRIAISLQPLTGITF